MSIQSLSAIPLASMDTNSDIGIAVMSKALKSSQEAGAQMVRMMDQAPAASLERSVNPHIGGNFDASV